MSDGSGWKRAALATLTCLLLAGCEGVGTAPDGRRVKVSRGKDGSITVTVLPPPGGPNGATAGRPGTGTAKPVPEPSLPAPKPVPPPPVVVTLPPPATAPSSTDRRTQLEKQYGVRILGKDSETPEYLDTLAFALGRFPPSAHRGLDIHLDLQSMDITGGIGGYWTVRNGKPMLVIYQPGEQYVHIGIHELAHNFDLWTNRGRTTPALLAAGKVGGQVPAENIPSPYARYGLQHPGKEPEWGAEVISWSLDRKVSSGFSTYGTWKPRPELIDQLDNFLESNKLVFQ